MLGCGDSTSLVYQGVIQELRKTFSFREWQDGDSLEYCGASIIKDAEGIRVGHQAYLKKIKPMTLPKHVGPDHELSQRELTELRGLLGSLQWPAVQSSPHLQASTSMPSGSVSTGRAQAVMDANRLLKFAKENSDVGLSYPPLGPVANLRMITVFDVLSAADLMVRVRVVTLFFWRRGTFWRPRRMFITSWIGGVQNFQE